MSRYKIHIDPPKPDPERMHRGQNFDELYREFRSVRRFEFWRKLYRDPKVFAGLAAAIAVIFLVFEAVKEEQRPSAAADSSWALPAAPAQQWTLPAGQAHHLPLPNGWVLDLPAQVFADSSGQTVGGEVTLGYWPIDSLPAAAGPAPGAPVFVLRATKQGQPLTLAGKASLLRQVALAPELQQRQTDHWLALATPGPTAPQQAHPRPTRPAILDQAPADRGIKLAAEAPQRPGKPFGLRISNLADFPQFRGYDRTFWEYQPVAGYADPWDEGLIDATWNDVRLAPYRGDAYQLTFSRVSDDGGMEYREVIATPYLEAATEAAAMAIYRDRLARYDSAVAEQTAAREQLQAFEAAQAQARRDYEQALAEWQTHPSTDSSGAATWYFPIDSLGWFAESD